jgi:hypothetical protein
MLEEFNFSLLDHEDFKEDSVREELLVPILTELGYSASGNAGITRSKPLVHPYVMIGSQKRKINIIPDYILTLDSKPIAIIDAKAPDQPVTKSHHVEQAFSYAIHPDIRVRRYALFNGKELAVYDIGKFEPVLNISIQEIITDWDRVKKVLSPQHIVKPELADFADDLGLQLLKSGADKDLRMHFVPFWIFEISMMSIGNYTTFSVMGDANIGVTVDYNQVQLDTILSLVSEQTRQEIYIALQRAPYRIQFSNPIEIVMEAKLGELTRGEFEEFVPFVIVNIDVEKSKSLMIG